MLSGSLENYKNEVDISQKLYKKFLAAEERREKEGLETRPHQEADSWFDQLQVEFAQIFDLNFDPENPDNEFSKIFGLFRDKIVKSMTEKSLFLNVPLKLEIWEFIQANRKVFKC